MTTGGLNVALRPKRPVSAPTVPDLVEPRRSKPSETNGRGRKLTVTPPPKPTGVMEVVWLEQPDALQEEPVATLLK